MSQVLSSPPAFLDLLKEVLDEEEVKSKQDHSEFRHYPSSASYKSSSGQVVGACLRQLYYRTVGQAESDPRDLTNKLQALFGQAIHDGLLKRLQKSKRIRITPESGGRVLVDPLTREISFRLDGLVTFEGTTGGLEIKTQQGYGLQRMMKEGGPKDSDLLQIVNYFNTNEAIQWFSLVYVARDTAYRAEFHIVKQEDGRLIMSCASPSSSHTKEIPYDFAGIVSRWTQLEKHVQDRTLPVRDYKAVLSKDGRYMEKRTKNGVDYKSDWRCNYCSYKTHCWTQADAKESSYQIPGD